MTFTSAASFFDPLSWTVYPEIPIGPGISPHGIGIAVGFLLGAQLMTRRARRFGGPPETDIWNALFYALIGAIVGARAGYVFGHFSEVTDGGDDILGIFKIWEGGISLIGGITGAILFALPYVLRRRMGFWQTMDLAAPGLALGIVIGRIGDLVIGDHLGEPTNFALGWLCSGSGSDPPLDAEIYLQALSEGQPPSLGCYDLVLHQTALYDLLSTLVLLGVLLFIGRKARPTGLLILTFTIWYAAMRVITDFLRVDKRYFGLTGSQLMSIAVGVICLYLLARYRGAPYRYRRPPEGGGDGAGDRSPLPPDPGDDGEKVGAGAKTTSESVTESDERPI
ncbi:MAG: prolipoprotein diacylglyceryl transferase [Actinobacteria bacterium]|nr:prolipoprotein diacylglyceryl transferase [Actinomycetota bacterium]